MSAADSSEGVPFGAVRKVFPSPSSPCTSGAVFKEDSNGLSAPEATGILAPAISHILSVLREV